MSYGHACWWSAGVSAAATGAGAIMYASENDSEPTPALALLTGAGAMLLTSAIVCGVLELSRYAYTETKDLTVSAQKDGYVSEVARVVVPSETKQIELGLQPAFVGGVVGGIAVASRNDVVAVFDLEDPEKKMSPSTLEQLSDYLASRLTASGGYQVVPRDRIKAQIHEAKTRSYAPCVDDSCQIELGKAVAAQKTLVSKVLRIGQTCTVTAVLYDLKKEAAERASTVSSDCRDESLLASLGTIAEELR